MLRMVAGLACLLLSSCGSGSDEEQLQEAAEQSGPAAAAVLNNAAENGMDPQQALELAGQAEAVNADGGPSGSLQARPNSAADPNPAQAGQPPEKVVTNGS